MLFMLAGPASATLPDNRAYEMVSPIEKGGLSFLANLAVTDAAGEHVIVDGGSKNSLLSNGASWMLETRTPAGWSGVQIGPQPAEESESTEQTTVSLNAVSEDFSSFAFQARMALDPRDTTHGMEEYVRQGVIAPFTWTTGPPAPAVPVSEPTECESGLAFPLCATNRAVFAGASASLQDVVWGEYHPLLAPPAALAGYPADTHAHGFEVYELAGGVDRLVGLVPAGPEPECGHSHGSCVVPPCGAAMGNADARGPFGAFAPVSGAVSRSGSQVVFTSPDPSTSGEVAGCSAAELYVRVEGTTTIQVSASAKSGTDPNGPKDKVYAGSSEEDGRLNTVFFTSKEELTNAANTGGSDQGTNLYAYTLATESQPAKLVDITPADNAPGGTAAVTFLGASTDGARVYFTASSELTAEPNSDGQIAKPGVSNLYLYDSTTGRTTFIASGAGLGSPHVGLSRGSGAAPRLTYELTPDGRHLVFVSGERLTEYNNFGPECHGRAVSGQPVRTPGPCAEVYLYTAGANSLVCVSCNPSGAPPSGSARLPEMFPEGYLDSFSEPGTLPAPRAVSDDGSRVFFNSPDRLTAEAPPPTTTIGPQVPMATNWEFEPSVYEYEGGGVHLIAPAAVLLTSTPSGKDVFFDTLSQLTPEDTDGSPDVYDARVAGGFPALAPSACSGTSCQGNPALAPIFATPASATFSGVGNFPPPAPAKATPKSKPKACRKGFVRRRVEQRSKCVRKPKAKKSAQGGS